MNWKSRRNYKKSRKAESVYAIVRYADWCVSEYKYAGKLKRNDFSRDLEPLVYHYNDHNGEYESYDIVPLSHTTSGTICGWTFSKDRADAVAYEHKILEKVNYGKAITN